MVREALGFSRQDELQEAAHFTKKKNVLTKWENDESSNPNLENLLNLLRFFDDHQFSIRWVLLGRGLERREEAQAGQLAEYLEIVRSTPPEAVELLRKTLQMAEEIGRQSPVSRTYKDAPSRAAEREEAAQARLDAEAEPAGQLAAAAHEPAARVVTISADELPRDWPLRWVPVINRVAAGARNITTAQADSGPPGWAEEYVEFPAPPARSFALRVAGASMLPRYASGDLLIVDPAREAAEGEPAVVVYRADGGRHDVQAKVKLWHRHGKRVTLASLAAGVKPITIDQDAVIHAFRVHAHLPLIGGRG